IGGDLPFVLCRHDQIADQKDQQIVINHQAVIVAVQSAATLLEHGRPEKHGAGERYQPKQSAQEIIPAVHERVLEPDVKNGRVLGDPASAHGFLSSANDEIRITNDETMTKSE